MMKKNSLHLFVVLTVVLFAVSCAPNIPLSVEESGHISSVDIKPVETRPGAKPMYNSRYYAISPLISIILMNEASNRLSEALEINGISIEAIVQDEFDAVIQDKFRPLNRENPDATFQVTVFNYGLWAHPGTLANTVKPIIALEGALIDRNGKELWRTRKVAGPSKLDFEAASLSGYIDDPDKLRNDIRVTTRKTVDKLVEHLLDIK